MTIKHEFESAFQDDNVPNKLQPSHWNAEHVDYTTPEAFGAVGDGITDDSDAIRAAIQHQHGSGGGVVKFGLKTYMCRDLDLPGGVTLQGSGWLTVLKMNGGEAATNLISAHDSYFGTIRDMILNGNKDECTGASEIVQLLGTDRYLLERVRLTNCAGDGAYLAGGFTEDGINNQFRDCYIDNNDSDGIVVENNCYDTIIQGCDIGANGAAGLKLTQGLSTGVFDTFFWGNSNGIYSYWGGNIHISGCRFENQDLAGIAFTGVRGFVINGCNFYANAKTQSWTPQDCHIFLYGDSTYDTKDGVITGNRIGSGGLVTEYAAYGVYDYNSPHVDYIMVTGNVIRGNGTAAVGLAGGNNVVTNNI